MPRFWAFLALVSLLEIPAVSGVYLDVHDQRGYYGGKKHRHDSSSSYSSSSEEQTHPHKPHRPPPPEPTLAPTCPSGWMIFNRIQGIWCVKVFYGPALQVTAQQLCQAQGANLTGVQDANENIQIAAAARVVINQNGGGNGEVWLGASRKPNCPVRKSCGPYDTFDWTDGHTTGAAGFQWGPTEPNGIIFPRPPKFLPWGQQLCLDQLVSGNSNKAAFGYPHGSMDDTHCQNTFKMYACGKTPS